MALAVLVAVFLCVPSAIAANVANVATAREPVLVPIRLPDPVVIMRVDSAERHAMLAETIDRIHHARTQHPSRLLVIDPGGAPLIWDRLTAQQQEAIRDDSDSKHLHLAYEVAVADFLRTVVEHSRFYSDGGAISMYGLPVEPEGVHASTVQAANDRFAGVIELLDAFVSRKSFIILNSSTSEMRAVRRGMEESLRLNNGRPLVFRTNGVWRIATFEHTDDAWDDDAYVQADDSPGELNEQGAVAETIHADSERWDRRGDAHQPDEGEDKDDPDSDADSDSGANSGGGGSSDGVSTPTMRGSLLPGGAGSGSGGGSGAGSGGGGNWTPEVEEDSEAPDPFASNNNLEPEGHLSDLSNNGDDGNGSTNSGSDGPTGSNGQEENEPSDGTTPSNPDDDHDDGDWDSWENTHDFTGLPMTKDGWTDLIALVQHEDYYQDARIIYVSSSTGQDTNLYKYHKIGDPNDCDHCIGDDPFNPQGEIHAYHSLEAGYARLRDGKPDMLLLKRGDTWQEAIPTWQKSGKSKLQPIIVCSYGNPSAPRPVIQRFTTWYGGVHANRDFSHKLLVGIEFSGGVAIQRQIGGKNWLIEDCAMFDHPSNGINLQGAGPKPLEKVAIRRSVIVGRHPTSSTGHIQGIFADRVHGLLIEECVLDHNGWNPDVAGGDATTFNHNVYITYRCTDVQSRKNISARASASGFFQRSGGISENNLFLQNPTVSFGYSMGSAGDFGPFGGLIRNNVTLDAADSHGLGSGLRMEALDDVEVYGNVFAHRKSADGNRAAIEFGHWGTSVQSAKDVLIRDNVVYRWDMTGSGRGVRLEPPSQTQFNNFVIRDNRIQQHEGTVIGITGSGDSTGLTFQSNQYYSTNGAPFSPGNSFNAWVSAVGDTASTFASNNFPDAGRDIQSYMAAIGYEYSKPEDALNKFLSEARTQRRGNWKEAFTAQAVNAYIREGFGLPEKGLE